MQRREFLTSLFSSAKSKEVKEIIVRPPFYEKEEDFLKCVDCDAICVTVCEQKIIKINEQNTPYLDFSNNGCTYCDECAIHCPKEVLTLNNKKNINVEIYIDESLCLSWNNTMCFSCKDPCIDDAIDFTAMFKAKINYNCTSCGYCIKQCPTNAIQIKEKDASTV